MSPVEDDPLINDDDIPQPEDPEYESVPEEEVSDHEDPVINEEDIHADEDDHSEKEKEEEEEDDDDYQPLKRREIDWYHEMKTVFKKLPEEEMGTRREAARMMILGLIESEGRRLAAERERRAAERVALDRARIKVVSRAK